MKTKLHKALFIGALALLGAQTSQAQQYFGEPFGGTAQKIGTAVGVSDKIQLEDFDGLQGFPDGFNIGANFSADAFGTYYDKSAGGNGVPGNNAGGDVAGTYRPTGEVDIVDIAYDDGTSGYVITGVQGGEYQLITIEVVTSGTYHLNLNFRSFGANKRYQIAKHSIEDLSAPAQTIFNATSADAADGTLASTNDPDDGGYIFRDSHDSQPFVLEAGTYVFRFRTLDGGPNFDYVSFTLDSTDTASVDDAEAKGSSLSAYPNPAIGGVFNLSEESKWEVYNVLGVKMLKGEGTSVDLSQIAKGIYILKTPYTSKTLISK
ncbi:T9SS type A sorting domain-containing protein [Polaribacter butkevichii]|uniref:Secretion system C-terminal sorting domain-containing protein n=1 Tax=Polaribacter butkevichii TaxID=218490 RepID=A0A2P6CCJ7_9FLAO|nr:T9SS type A sorting domain-containing protein [Polaribacter butkevichii]PQJ72627.1 hypothetical protein BTO14_04875 [Polaribacter butkevichii]